MPEGTALYIDAAMTQVSADRAKNNYVADFVFPRVESNKSTGKIWVLNKDEVYRIHDTLRAPGSAPKAFENKDPSTIAFTVEDHSLEGFVSDEEAAQADNATRPMINEVENLTDAIMLRKEYDLVTAIQAAATAATISTAGLSAAWGTAATGDAVGDLKGYFDTIEQNIGQSPNRLVIGEDVLRKVSEQDAWKERIYDTMGPVDRRAMGDAAILEALLFPNGGRVMVVGSWKNTAQKGQSASFSRVWSDSVLLFYGEDSPGLRTQSFGLTVSLSAAGGGGPQGAKVARERIERRSGEAVYVHNYYDQKLLNAGAAYWLTNAI